MQGRCSNRKSKNTFCINKDIFTTNNTATTKTKSDSDVSSELLIKIKMDRSEDQSQAMTDSEKNSSSFLKCKFEDCEETFLSTLALGDHINSHSNAKKRTCTYPECNLIFLKNINYKQHVQSHYMMNKFYPCNYPNCSKKFTAIYNLKVIFIF